MPASVSARHDADAPAARTAMNATRAAVRRLATPVPPQRRAARSVSHPGSVLVLGLAGLELRRIGTGGRDARGQFPCSVQGLLGRAAGGARLPAAGRELLLGLIDDLLR